MLPTQTAAVVCHRHVRLVILAGLVLAASGANCLWPWPKAQPKERAAGLRGFGSAEELRQFLADQANARLNANRGGGGWWSIFLPMPMSAPTSDMDSMSGQAGGEGSGQDPFSTTNLQEVGVDESDILKNDGQYIYWLKGSTIHVASVTPPDALAQVATIALDVPGDSLYLRARQLVALSRNWTYGVNDGWDVWDGGTVPSGTASSGAESAVRTAAAEPLIGPWFDGSETVVTVFDVSDPADPARQATLRFEGQLVASRLIDHRLYLVMTTYPRLPTNPTPAAIGNMALEDWLPACAVVSPDGQTSTGNITPWENYYRPIAGDGYQITTVVTVDLDDPAGPFASTAITANAGTIYASTQALYITDTQYDWDFNSSRTDTMIHKMAFTETGTDYVASGLIPGRPLNQYSLGEYEGYLRIATTQEAFSVRTGAASTNSVYVLGVTGTDLAVVGQVDDLGIGETIYAARFIGPRGFLVTFQRIDPLFTLDLSEPANPRVVGQLKVPGYSDHIQLIDADHLLTIGKDAQEAGDWGAWVQGVQLSIFDVSDMANPQLKHKEIIGGRGTHSEANNDPKAFNYFPDRSALAFPIELYSAGTTGPQYGRHEFTGLLVYRVSVENGFQRLGRLSTVPETPSPRGCFWDYYGSTRGVFIGDYVYAVSNLGVKSAPLEDASTVIGQLDFTNAQPQEACDFIMPLTALRSVQDG